MIFSCPIRSWLPCLGILLPITLFAQDEATKGAPDTPVAITDVAAPSSPPPPIFAVKKDWRWIKGAVFVPTNCVNEAQMWDQYDPATIDRELHYASFYGLNCVRVYLHYAIYLKKKDALLHEIDDFLARADKYGIKTEFIFFDDCWLEPPPDILSSAYTYPAPIYGVHNSQWLRCPGDAIKKALPEHQESLRAYVQDIVKAHLADPRIAFWETYNEPNRSGGTKELMRLAQIWIHETGTTIPLTATGRNFTGDPYSDFGSFHKYSRRYDGGKDEPEVVCTECMNRERQTIPDAIKYCQGKLGFIFWELGIGRDNCRFSWKNTIKAPATTEPKTPFHGFVYPDGHPWAIDDAKALMGKDAYDKAPVFNVQYFKDDAFTQLAKTSITPLIDFNLSGEEGTGSPDASAGISRDQFSIVWTGTIAARTSGTYTFFANSDAKVIIAANGQTLVTKDTLGKEEVSATLDLIAQKPCPVEIRYSHTGASPASLHFLWAGPGLEKQAVLPIHPQSVASGP